MRHNTSLLLLLLLFFLRPVSALDADSTCSQKLLIIQPTGESLDDFPVMRILPDTSGLYMAIKATIDSSAVKDFVDLYTLVQQYAVAEGIVESVEPAYLAITSNEGGYAKKGFYLEGKEGLLNKTLSPYVDITEKAATADRERLMSFTQLYPHELGHVLYHLLSSRDSLSTGGTSVDMHYFSLVTDYSTAFNEGFAEHMENVSRLTETNPAILEGIEKDTKVIKALVEYCGPRFRKDMRNPLRLGYYKATMINWYQKYEDYKRYEHALSGEVRFRTVTPPFRDVEDRLTYRNTGIEWDSSQSRNLVQLHSTEGVISAFFTKLTTSRLGREYRETEFYSPFIMEAGTGREISSLISPVQNMFIKYFYVFRNSMVENHSERSQLIDFIEGYIHLFPGEEDQVRAIYESVMGMPYSDSLPPPAWILVSDHRHRMLTLDAYGAIEVPVYTFDLNAAREEDLLTIKELREPDAQAILDYRNAHGFFSSLEELREVPGLDQDLAGLLISKAYDQAVLQETLEDFEYGLSLGAVLVKPLLDILLRISAWFLLSYLLLFFLFKKRKTRTFWSRFFHIARLYLLWVFTAIAGLAAVLMTGSPLPAVCIYGALLLLIAALVYRRKKTALAFTASMFLLMLLPVILSIT